MNPVAHETCKGDRCEHHIKAKAAAELEERVTPEVTVGTDGLDHDVNGGDYLNPKTD